MTNAGIKPLKHWKVVMYEQLSRGQKAQLYATAFYLIRSIVEKHGGTVEMDLATDAIKICVPQKEGVACAKKIEEQLGAAPIILGRSGDDESSGMLPL
jgi:hypothetical protein